MQPVRVDSENLNIAGDFITAREGQRSHLKVINPTAGRVIPADLVTKLPRKNAAWLILIYISKKTPRCYNLPSLMDSKNLGNGCSLVSVVTTTSKSIIKMEQEPIITKRVSAGTRIYYLDAFKDSKGQPYLSISEIPTDKSPGNKKRQRIFIHNQNFNSFVKSLNEMITELSNDTPR